MRKQKIIFSTLLVSFILGLGMVTTGLASLPPPYEVAKTVVMNPNVDKIISELPQEKIIGDDIIETEIPESNSHNHKIKRGESLGVILQNYGVDAVEAAEAIGELDDHFNMRALRAGDSLQIELDGDDVKHIKSISFKPSITKTIELYADEAGNFKTKAEEIKLEKILLKAKGSINGSFYQSAMQGGVTPSIIGQLITALSYDVDFQRDIQPGNKFTILFEGYTTPEGQLIKSSRPLYVKLEMRKKVVEMYIVPKSDGTLGYYHADGSSAKKALLRTPVDAAKITSAFGMRRHPILGYTKMHKGVDFGAPPGTPIYAAGDGIIEKAGYSNGYGNFVLLRHNDKYETAYGHASRFGKGIKPGVKVRQGQIIAYVGSTGAATGPHLHYEVRVKGTQVNPLSVNLPIDNRLDGKELAKFTAEKKQILAALSDAPTKAELADLIKDEDDATDKPEVEAAPTTIPAIPKPAAKKGQQKTQSN